MAAASPDVIVRVPAFLRRAFLQRTDQFREWIAGASLWQKSYPPVDDVFDPVLEVTDLAVQHGLEALIHAFDSGLDVLLFSRGDLRQKSFAHIDDLAPPRRQSPENTQVLAWQMPSSLWPELHEPADEPGIDLVGLCPRAPGRAKALICAGGSCTVSTPAATRVAHSTHS